MLALRNIENSDGLRFVMINGNGGETEVPIKEGLFFEINNAIPHRVINGECIFCSTFQKSQCHHPDVSRLNQIKNVYTMILRAALSQKWLQAADQIHTPGMIYM